MHLLISLLAGALTPFSIAPYSHWWLGLLTLGILSFILSRASNKKAIFYGALAFGLGYFTTGLYWIYHSIHVFGSAPVPLALLLMAIFIGFLALVFALPFTAMGFIRSPSLRLLLGFPLCWALSEWLRGWLLTGLPWLYVGYGHYETFLIGWAPVGGVLLIGLWCALSSSIGTHILCTFSKRNHQTAQLLTILAIIWVGGGALQSIAWTQASGKPLTVGLVQPDIALAKKWDPDYREPTMNILMALSEPLWDEVDWLFWPEAAIPDLYYRSSDILPLIDEHARLSNTHLVTGILFDEREQQKIYNSVVGLGKAEGLYFKQRLVPFGEYVPLEQWLRGLIDFFNLPNSFISRGPSEQKNIQMGDTVLSSAICYEIVYPALVAKQTRGTHAILTISNDAWFGESVGPLQHFHMARMRAIETGRYVIRATNNGVSAIIDEQGNIIDRGKQFTPTYLKGNITPMQGNTPYMLWQNSLFLLIVLLLGVICFFTYRDNNQT